MNDGDILRKTFKERDRRKNTMTKKPYLSVEQKFNTVITKEYFLFLR